jgi:hypothetical protein
MYTLHTLYVIRRMYNKISLLYTYDYIVIRIK